MANKKKRLIDLEVDEVSLVDKPAIGETVYLTKRVEDNAVKKKKGEKVTKADPKTDDAAVTTKTDEGETDTSTDDEVEDTEADEEDDAGGDGDADSTDATKAMLNSMNKRFTKLEKSMVDVEAMLAQSLQLHEMVTVHLNELLSLNLGALDAVMMMMEEQTDDETAVAEPAAAENQTMSQKITEIRESVKAVRQQVLKAGAKMSRTRLQALRDIAAKLTELITSVEPVSAEDTEKKTVGTKKAALLAVTKTVQASLETVTAELGDCMNKQGELLKTVAKLDERLKGVEGTAGASDAIDDDETESDDSQKDSKSREKSVFHGLIPVDTIRESVRKRSESAKK